MLFILSLVIAASGFASALPFGKDSGVTELTPQTLTSFLNTHKPVFIMFYAPWCGHCKSAHPEWEKFAKGVKDVVKVGAIDADKHRDLGGQFGVKGFPTIKYWKMGSKKGKQPNDYQGQRTHGAFHNAALAEIAGNVPSATSLETVSKELSKSSSKKAVLLFTSKTKSPPMFTVLSQSPHFSGKISFLMVNEKLKSVVDHFGAKTFPSVALISFENDNLSATFFDGKLEYTPIAKFIQANVQGLDAESDSVPETKPEAKPKSEKPAETPKKFQPASPVRPVTLTADAFAMFCGPDAPKVRGQQPFCVVALKSDAINFDVIHAHYQNEPVHFFNAPEDTTDAARWMNDLADGLQPVHPLEPIDIVILRAAKDRTKFVIYRADGGQGEGSVEDHFDAYLGRALGGDITFYKNPGFPKLTAKK